MKNKGMLLEKIINKTIDFYWKNKIAYIEKKQIPIKFVDITKNGEKKNVSKAYLSGKSTVDYIGCYKGIFVCFEAKTCNEDNFYLANIQKHQLEYLRIIKQSGGESFIVLFFSHNNTFWKVGLEFIEKAIKEGKKHISYNDVKSNCLYLELEFPGLLSFL
ncbi:Holliday junction resolvase RecU [Mycoplasmopsis gallinacea]|uniref:Holliday junction resolvase RecU n=1 Tax=Mycoplasmopsis gallinacea TaxID=29556 RepID=A0A0D5ZJL7_9BACT|nr:Holliday junction resolvase RecU [Mycoplasmopsis gallinacea]AKA50083.1 endonuclease [Mycoplasmopsis gallinacea]QIW62138.1 Holliday junction resolvase RecU [Mycoplasmopsis gallinacea]VEU58783.1 penicillin-binding protein-related factor A recombinase [Mycoplasmopsis gallinacea]